MGMSLHLPSGAVLFEQDPRPEVIWEPEVTAPRYLQEGRAALSAKFPNSSSRGFLINHCQIISSVLNLFLSVPVVGTTDGNYATLTYGKISVLQYLGFLHHKYFCRNEEII